MLCGLGADSRDTYLGEPERPASLNQYAYAENNPVSNIDPGGTWSIKALTSNALKSKPKPPAPKPKAAPTYWGSFIQKASNNQLKPKPNNYISRTVYTVQNSNLKTKQTIKKSAPNSFISNIVNSRIKKPIADIRKYGVAATITYSLLNKTLKCYGAKAVTTSSKPKVENTKTFMGQRIAGWRVMNGKAYKDSLNNMSEGEKNFMAAIFSGAPAIGPAFALANVYRSWGNGDKKGAVISVSMMIAGAAIFKYGSKAANFLKGTTKVVKPKTIDDIIKSGKNTTKIDRGTFKNIDIKGTFNTAKNDFNSLHLKNVKTTKTTYGTGYVGYLEDGAKVSIRSGSQTGGSTMEILYKNGNKVKIRYN